MSSKLTIHGPNLNDQSKGTFHVHTADCRDNDREVKNNGSVDPWTIDADSIDDVVDHVYSDQFAEQPDRREPDSYEHYVADFHFAPCVKLNRRDGSAPTKPAAKRGEPLKLASGQTPAKLVLQFVTERASSTPDAGGQERPFITSKNKVVIRTPWLRAWLAQTLDTKVSASHAGAMLRDLGYKRRQVPMIGTGKTLAPWAWIIDAPKSMKDVERQPAPEPKPAAAKPAAAKPAAKSASKRATQNKSKSTSKRTTKRTQPTETRDSAGS